MPTKRFRLPTEAQWEYAARGGKFRYTHTYKYAGSNHLKEVDWYDRNSHNSTQAVGLKMPNVLGLSDMSGKVFEWCTDAWHDYTEGLKTGDQAEENRRVIRGGSWFDCDVVCRVAVRCGFNRFIRLNFVGFRLSCYPLCFFPLPP